MRLKTKGLKRWTSIAMTTLLLTSTFLPSGLINRAEAALADHLVISQVYGGGGNSGAVYTNDFIELYNPTNSDIDLSGWSVQYTSSTGSTWAVTALSNTIKAHGYFLIQGTAGSTVTNKPLPTADVVNNGLSMGGSAGKVALVNTTTALSGKNPQGTAGLIDFVGYGTGADGYEGTGPTPSVSNSTSAQRRPYANVSPGGGKGNAWDTNDNTADFASLTPVARNTASPTEDPMVSNTSLQPIGNNIQFTKQGTDGKLKGNAGAVPSGATVNIYDSAAKTTNLSTATANADGSFEATFSVDQATSIFVSAKEASKDESDAIEIQVASVSASLDGTKLSYMIDSNNVGILTGNAGAGVASSLINIYPNDTTTITERLLTGEVKVGSNGAFTATFNNAPNTIYVTQQSSSSKGIKLESVPVSVTKTATDQVTSINDVRLSDASGKPVNLNKYYTVEGIVTVDNGILGTQKQNFYVQDNTGGMNVFSSSYDPGFSVVKGDKVRITGKVIYYNGLTEFEPTSISKINEGNALPVSKDSTILDLTTYATAEPLEGSLVIVTGKVSATASTPPNYNVTFVDENNKAITLRVMDKTGIKPDTDLVVGKSYTVTGILGQYTTNANATNGYQIYPRDVKDIASVLNITHTPITEGYKDTNIYFEAIADGAEAVKVYYRATSGTNYTELPMVKGSEGRYTATLDAANVPQSGFEYYIEAAAGAKTKTAGTSTAPYAVTLVDDLQGPSFNGETPQDKTKVESSRPEISVLMNDPSGVDVSTIQLWFDGNEIKASDATFNKSQVKYALTQDLALGTHTVKVVAKDTKGNASEKEWTFESVKRFTGGNHYRGTTHNHTNISHDASGTPEDALKAGKAHNYDFFAFSDHSHDIDASLSGTDNVDRKGMLERTGGAQWQSTKDLAKQYTKNGEYVVFPAFEMTSTTWGHSNIFGTENFIDRNINGKQYQDLNKFYAWVLTYDDIVGQFNHPDMSANAFNNFKPYDKNLDKLFTMFEVGNGSGHYGYANADKKFFSTLDLGWHVAPTYGEDNHEGSWGQTNARTVIVADDLSTDSLMHSMRNMRVYMEEDPNFTLDVLANGYYMGSTVDSKTLNFNISGSDLVAENHNDSDYSHLPASYQSDDRIAKVELITNGGKVVDSIAPMTKDFNWKPSYTVSSGQQWFVVKVTQMDGERIYSSPIWSKEEAVDVKVNSIDVVGDVIVGGNPATLKATVANNGTETINNLKVDFYYDAVDQAHFIGTNTISSIVSKSSATATATWASPIIGDHQLIAVVTSNDGLDIGDVKFTLPIKIKEPLGIKVLIDAFHGNENTTGDSGTYRDNLKAYTVMLQKEGYTVVENKQAITDAVLSNVQVLMITATRTALSADERTAVAKFVKNGGSLLLTSKSNNSSDPTISNPILADIGTTIRLNNDGVFDDSKTGNFWSDPKVAPFAVRIHPGLVSNYMTDRVSFLDYYSGASLAGANDQPLVEGGKVVILGKGNETTYEGNIKGGVTYDNVSDDKGGSAIPLIASEEIGANGRVIVSGMNIFNDKQMDESYEPKGNNEFSLNAVNWLAHRETKISNIADVRQLADDKEAVIEGTVTTAAGVFFDAFYVQDATGGIMAFKEAPEGSLKLGDKVRIYGHMKTFENNKEFEFDSFAKDVIKIGSTAPVEPKEVTTGTATSDENQGLLVKVTGKVVSKYDENSYVINDGSGDTLIFTDGYIINQSGPVPNLKIGDTLEAVGLSGKFKDGNRLRVRDTKELKQVDTTAPGAPTVNPITDKDEKIIGTTEAGAKVIAKVGNTEIGQATADQTGSFEITIAKQVAGTKVEVTAIDEKGNESEVTEVQVSDVTAPTAPTVNPITDKDVKINGTTEAGAKVISKVGNTEIGQATADHTGSFEITIAKQVAGTKVEVTATDEKGNESVATEITVSDVTAPAAPTVNPITDKDEKISGTTEAGAKVIAKAGNTEIGQATADQTGHFEMTITKQVAGTKVEVTATDEKGNESEVTEVTVSDVTAPTAPLVSQIKDYEIVIGKAEAGSTIIVSVGNTVLGKGVTTPEGIFSIQLSSKQKIGTILSVVSVDKAGNRSDITNVTVVDTTPPDSPIVKGVVKDNDKKIKGTAEAYSKVVVKIGDKVMSSDTADSKGKFTLEIPRQKIGTVLYIIAIDEEGNESKPTKIIVQK